MEIEISNVILLMSNAPSHEAEQRIKMLNSSHVIRRMKLRKKGFEW